jgi:DNA-binding response OmpR family regulator
MKQLYKANEVVNKNFSVLHVDGDMLMRKVLKKTFSGELFTLDSAANGKEAFLFLKQKQYRYDIVITEMHMHYANGYEIVNRIREQAPGCTVIITSNMSFLHIREGLNLERANYFKKPLVVGKLIERINSIQFPGTGMAKENFTDTVPAMQLLSSVFENNTFKNRAAAIPNNETELIAERVLVDPYSREDELQQQAWKQGIAMEEQQIADTIITLLPVAREVLPEMQPQDQPIRSIAISGNRWW